MDEKSDTDAPSLRECESADNKLSAKPSTSLLLKQSSNNSLPPPPNSPNSSDNVSSLDNTTVDEHDVNNSDKRGRNKSNNSGSVVAKDDSGHCENPKSVSNNSAICALGSKDEVANVLSVKKEERSLSPVSPVGYDSVNPLSSIDIGAGRRSTGKPDEPTNTSNKSEKVSSPGNNVASCKDEFNTNNLTSGNGSSNTSNASLASQSSFNNNCLELMQHQNHVFVFSTQLANKAAESVLSGKFHSIIAYHCTQPQTKNFLDEFFIKNPMKITKMTPRNLNMNSQIAGGSHSWPSSSPVGNMSKPTQKAINNNKQMGFPAMLNTNADSKIAGSKMANFTDGDGDSELVQCWDTSARNALATSEQKPIPDGNINSPAPNIEKSGAGMSDSIPFLQGRKIPDENLTPQQRQHREEQLAKLKKMNQFLFPENDAAQTAKLPGGENLPPGMGNMLMNVSNGPPLRNNNMLQPPQKGNLASICEPDNSLSSVSLMTSQSEQISAALQAKTTPAATGVNCDTNIVGSNNSLGACGPPAPNLLMANSASDVSAMPVNIGNGFNAGEDVINSMDWAKMQNQNMNRMNPASANVGSNTRPGHLQNATTVSNSQRNQPPPPYHSTQRSASVPIATQSPNPSSPNNPTSNLSMPSPASSGVPGAGSVSGAITNSPNVDMINTANSTNPKTGSFTHEANNNSNRNRQLSSNPSTPLSHMSPKELEFNSNTAVTDPQQTSGDSRFPPSSPSYNFPLNNYKSQLERPGNVPAAPFIGGPRRTDNLPLNPNSNRMPQGKLGPNMPFDPISSLAQMSQQLSCASSGPVGNTGGNNNIAAGELGMPSNIGLNHHQNLDGMLQQSMGDGGIMDGSSIIPGGGPPFGPNNMNPMMMGGPMNTQHRLMNPKMCGAFNNNGPGSVNSGFHGMPPNPHHHRMRMAGGMNFNNFNVTPNVQVKASTPNTIQYMPVRSQNNNSNMRAPPSLDFLPRYPLNPGQPPPENQNAHGINLMGMQSDMVNKLNSNINSGNNAVSNNNGAPSGVMGFFQHCHQEQEDMSSSTGGNPSGMINSSHDMMRGIRPMLRPGGANSNSNLQYGGNQQSQDPLDCGDMFGAQNPNSNPNQMFPVSGGKPGNNKMGGGMVMGGNNSSLCLNIGANISGLEHTGMSNMMGAGVPPNTSNSGSAQLPVGGNNNMNYKSFVGPSSNDIKYAQQYHSFQQQLYATSTRSQQQNGNNLSTPSSANVQSTNSPFYNK